MLFDGQTIPCNGQKSELPATKWRLDKGKSLKQAIILIYDLGIFAFKDFCPPPSHEKRAKLE